VLSEVLVDELGQGGHSRHPALAPELLQGPLQRRLRVGLTPEATTLHALRVALARSVPVGPETLPVSIASRKLEYLTRRSREQRTERPAPRRG
jgi:hypothetical protein